MVSTDVLDIAPIGPDQSEAVWPLSIEAGWNQNAADWRFMLGAGRGFGFRDAEGRWEASSLVLPLGAKLAWISIDSPLARAVLKKSVDDEFAAELPGGPAEFTVIAVDYD